MYNNYSDIPAAPAEAQTAAEQITVQTRPRTANTVPIIPSTRPAVARPEALPLAAIDFLRPLTPKIIPKTAQTVVR